MDTNQNVAPASAADSTPPAIPSIVDTSHEDFALTVASMDTPSGQAAPTAVEKPRVGGTQNPPPPNTPAVVAPVSAAQSSQSSQTSQQDLIKSAIEQTAASTAQAIRSVQPPAAPTPPITEQELYNRYGVPTVTDATMHAIMDPDPKKGAAVLQAMLQQTATATLRMANDIHKAGLEQERARYEPQVKSWQAYQDDQKAKAADTAFFAAHPDLVGEDALVKEMVDATKAKVAAGQIKFANEQEAYNFVAAATRNLTSRMTPRTQGTPLAGQQSPAMSRPGTSTPQATPQHTRAPAMATSSARGGGTAKPASSELDNVMDAWGVSAPGY